MLYQSCVGLLGDDHAGRQDHVQEQGRRAVVQRECRSLSATFPSIYDGKPNHLTWFPPSSAPVPTSSSPTPPFTATLRASPPASPPPAVRKFDPLLYAPETAVIATISPEGAASAIMGYANNCS